MNKKWPVPKESYGVFSDKCRVAIHSFLLAFIFS